jgi:hypothetical protein
LESASLEVFLSSFAKQKHRKSIGGGKSLDDLLVSEHQSGFIYRNCTKGIQNAMVSFGVASLQGNMVATFTEIYTHEHNQFYYYQLLPNSVKIIVN